jgi:hypothetical protein
LERTHPTLRVDRELPTVRKIGRLPIALLARPLCIYYDAANTGRQSTNPLNSSRIAEGKIMLERRTGFGAFIALAFIVVAGICYLSGASQPLAMTPTGALPTAGRWQIHRSEMAYAMTNTDTRSATNTILLDSATGETWLLWPTDTDGKRQYSWILVPKQK